MTKYSREICYTKGYDNVTVFHLGRRCGAAGLFGGCMLLETSRTITNFWLFGGWMGKKIKFQKGFNFDCLFWFNSEKLHQCKSCSSKDICLSLELFGVFENLYICKIWRRAGFSRQVREFLKITVLTNHLQLERKSLATPKQGGEKHCKVAYKGKELTVQTLLLLQSSLCLQKRKGKPIPSKFRAREGTCLPGVGCGGGSQCPCRSGQCCAAVVITGSSWIILFGILYLSMLFCGRSNLLSYFAWKPSKSISLK